MEGGDASVGGRRDSLCRWLRCGAWGYLLSAVAGWLILFMGGDRWWPATMVLFGPRWPALVPLVVLVPLSLWRCRPMLLPLILGGMVVAGPFMGACLPWCHGGRESARAALRVLTCNLQAGDFNRQRLAELVRDSRTDIVALQECPRELGLNLPPGWSLVQEGGLAVASRFPLRRVGSFQTLHPPHTWPRTSMLQCLVLIPGRALKFCTVHLPSPRYGLQTVLDRHTVLSPARKGLLISETANRLQAARDVARLIASLSPPVVVAGDFNMPVESTIYREYWQGLANAFSQTGCGYGWTVGSTVGGIPVGVRVDHILSSKELAPLASETGPDIDSDHLPLLADISLPPVSR